MKPSRMETYRNTTDLLAAERAHVTLQTHKYLDLIDANRWDLELYNLPTNQLGEETQLIVNLALLGQWEN